MLYHYIIQVAIIPDFYTSFLAAHYLAPKLVSYISDVLLFLL